MLVVWLLILSVGADWADLSGLTTVDHLYPQSYLKISSFFDADLNGIKDPTEAFDTAEWSFEVTSPKFYQAIHKQQAPYLLLDADSYVVYQGTRGCWLNTLPQGVQPHISINLEPNKTEEVVFGNVCYLNITWKLLNVPQKSFPEARFSVGSQQHSFQFLSQKSDNTALATVSCQILPGQQVEWEYRLQPSDPFKLFRSTVHNVSDPSQCNQMMLLDFDPPAYYLPDQISPLSNSNLLPLIALVAMVPLVGLIAAAAWLAWLRSGADEVGHAVLGPVLDEGDVAINPLYEAPFAHVNPIS